jgi:hypothetical protein
VGYIGLESVNGLLTVGGIRFDESKPESLTRASGPDQKLRSEATVTTPKVKHPDGLILHGQAVEVRCVGA